MAGTINIAAYSDALVVLGTAGLVVPLVQRLGFSPVLGYLGAGVLLGPLGLGSFIAEVPILYWVTVADAKNVAVIADLGVVFLLFLIGLELSFERLKAMRRLVFGLGSLQVVLSTAVIAGFLATLDFRPGPAILVGACLALSSTAIVIEVLARQGRLTTGVGRTSFSVLLAQDLAVVPILMLASILGSNGGGPLWKTVLTALVQALLALVIIVVVGRLVLRPIFRSVAETRSTELFVAAILFVIVATGVIADLAGLSMALGAFVAGLLLAETEYRKAIEATIGPFKGLLLGIFFFTVGMSIDLREVARAPVLLFASVAALVAVKALIMIVLCRLYRLSWPIAIETALLLGPGGEFALVGIGLAAALGVVLPEKAAFTLAVTSVSMALIPLLAMVATRVRTGLEDPRPSDPALRRSPETPGHHAIVIGYGRVGRMVTDLLVRHEVPFIAVDHDPGTVIGARSTDTVVYYGDATSPEFLKSCGLMQAAGVVITIHTQARIDDIVREVRRLRPDILIVARARDATHARHLYAIGVTDAVPETIEASLQLSEALLVGLGRPTGPVIASIHEKRDEVRAILQDAAHRAGQPGTRALRPKAKRLSEPSGDG